MSDYIKREDAIKAIDETDWYHHNEVTGKMIQGANSSANQPWYKSDDIYNALKSVPSADVVEVGIITCFGIKFVVEDDIIKVKWRHGDKHYIVPFGGLLDLWEKYEEQNHESNS